MKQYQSPAIYVVLLTEQDVLTFSEISELGEMAEFNFEDFN